MNWMSARSSRAPAPQEHGEARAGDLGRALEVEDARARARAPSAALGVKAKRGRLAHAAHLDVGRRVAARRARWRRAGWAACSRTSRRRVLDLLQPRLERLDLVGRRPSSRALSADGVLASPCRAARSPRRPRAGGGGAARPAAATARRSRVERPGIARRRSARGVCAAAREHLQHALAALDDVPQVEHDAASEAGEHSTAPC